MEEQDLNINELIAQVIEEHGYKTELKGNKIIPNFKETVALETWIYPQEYESCFTSRFDLGVEFENGQEVYECFADIGSDLESCIHKNIENFCNCSLHVLLDALNDTETFTDVEKWHLEGGGL